MQISFTTKPAAAKSKEAIALFTADAKKAGKLGTAIDKEIKGAVGRTLKGEAFDGKAGAVAAIYGTEAADQIVLVGLGEAEKLDAKAAMKAGGALAGHLNTAKLKSVEVQLDVPKGSALSVEELAANIAYGMRLRSYSFYKYHTTRQKELAHTLDKVTIVTEGATAAKKHFTVLEAIAEGIDMTKDLVSEPANVIYPESYAKLCKDLSKLGVKVEVLNKAQMEKLGMGALLGVAQGSAKEPKLVVMQWLGGKKNQKPVALVGKGVTFDTGGISIKPAQNMEDMKYDMAGSAAVVGTMKALAGRNAKANVVGVVGLVENMPDGNAQRPGDVVTSMSGQTIEVINTDAEGRLVLADALWYTQDRFKPQCMINLATLTGAIVIALGSSRAGLFSNSDDVSDKLKKAAETTGEELWRLPISEIGGLYDKQINTITADMKNVGEGREAGSITAAQFLQRFVNGTPWAHLDIAGVAWSGKGDATAVKGATGYGVRLLNEFIAANYE
ncbi:MAG: leucyl aminopeptidase [Rickettsiales bacterium]|nr:leucyl aminopeptidase [Rickettsiales bacterium]|tara:strand:+ start:425 stop:1924 length:1500 start_codon:yes stop_codon:yes gene_type:complete